MNTNSLKESNNTAPKMEKALNNTNTNKTNWGK